MHYRTYTPITTEYNFVMLSDFISSNRSELITRCLNKVSDRFNASVIPASTDHGVPAFLQQLINTLEAEQQEAGNQIVTREFTIANTEIGREAALHGTELLRAGYTVDQVVHYYGDVCQAITELAIQSKIDISTNDFRILNRSLDNAIADAVKAFGSAHQVVINDKAETLHECLNTFSEEQQRLLNIAFHSYAAMKTGDIGITGATGKLLFHTLEELSSLTDRVLPEIRLASASTTLALH